MTTPFNGLVTLSCLQELHLNTANIERATITQLSGCITDSITSTSSTIAASAAGLSNVKASCLPLVGGSISGDLTVNGQYHGDGSLLTGITGGGGGGDPTTAVTGINIVSSLNSNSSLVITAINTNNMYDTTYLMTPPDYTGIQVVDPGSVFNGSGSNSSSNSVILACPTGDLCVIAAKSLILQCGVGTDEVISAYGVQIMDPLLMGWTRMRIEKTGGGLMDAMCITSTGSGANQYAVITATKSSATFKNLYYTTVFGQTSDATLKTNVVPIPEALSILNQLNPVSFNWTSNALHGESDLATTNYGFLAQEVQTVMPNLVEVMDTGLLGIKALSFIPYLVKGIQELKARMDAFENK